MQLIFIDYLSLKWHHVRDYGKLKWNVSLISEEACILFKNRDIGNYQLETWSFSHCFNISNILTQKGRCQRRTWDISKDSCVKKLKYKIFQWREDFFDSESGYVVDDHGWLLKLLSDQAPTQDKCLFFHTIDGPSIHRFPLFIQSSVFFYTNSDLTIQIINLK